MNMKQRTVMVTGASRGIGREFALQYADQGYRVFATVRSPTVCVDRSGEREAGGAIEAFALDVTSPESVSELQSRLRGQSIDILINNAGVWGGERQAIGEMDYDAWSEAFEVNAIGPFRVIEAFRENIAISSERKIVTLTSEMGSIELGGAGAYAYRSSKAALNRIMRSLALDLSAEGILTLTMHPGWVRTDMGTSHAHISVEQSVAAMRKIIGSLDRNTSGRFVTLDGLILPW